MQLPRVVHSVLPWDRSDVVGKVVVKSTYTKLKTDDDR